MEDTNYINIQGWMVNHLSLKANHLIAFALIFGFSQDRESSFKGSLKYVQNVLQVSRPTASEVLKNLVEMNLIIKSSKVINGVIFNNYKANFYYLDSTIKGANSLGVVKNLYRGSKKSLQGGSKESLRGGSKESLHYNTNIDTTIVDNTNDNFYADAEQKKKGDDFFYQGLKEPDVSEKEKGSAEKEKDLKKITKEDFRQTLIKEGANAQHVADWFVVRDSHKAPYTLTALNKFLNECQNNNYPVSLAVQACAEYNWRGFEYQWVLNKQKYVTGQTTAAVTKPTASQDRQERIDSVKRMGDLARQIVANAINNG